MSKGTGKYSRRRFSQTIGETGLPKHDPEDIGETSITATVPQPHQRAENKPGARRSRETWVQKLLDLEKERQQRSGNPEG